MEKVRKGEEKIEKNTKILPILIVFFSVITLFLIDILAKYYFTGKKYFESNFFFITSTQNTGSAFSLFSNITYYNLVIGFLGIIFVLFLIYIQYFRKEFDNNKLNFVFILIIAGVLGNSFDRLIFGYTRDFIGFGNFFIFNIADFYLTLAVIIYILNEIKFEK